MWCGWLIFTNVKQANDRHVPTTYYKDVEDKFDKSVTLLIFFLPVLDRIDSTVILRLPQTYLSIQDTTHSLTSGIYLHECVLASLISTDWSSRLRWGSTHNNRPNQAENQNPKSATGLWSSGCTLPMQLLGSSNLRRQESAISPWPSTSFPYSSLCEIPAVPFTLWMFKVDLKKGGSVQNYIRTWALNYEPCFRGIASNLFGAQRRWTGRTNH